MPGPAPIFNYGIWKVLVNATTPVLSEANLDWLAEVARAPLHPSSSSRW